MTLFVQVLDENNSCKFDARIEAPDEVFHAPGSDDVTLAGVKTAIDYMLYLDKQAAEQAAK